MTVSRSSAALAALVAAMLASATPLDAQTTEPLLIVPQPAPEAVSPSASPPAAEFGVGDDVVLVEEIDPEAVGLYGEADGGFGLDVWRGSARVLDHDPNHSRTRRRIGYLPEQMRLPDYLRADGFLRYMGELNGVESRTLTKRIPELLELVGLGLSLIHI